MFLTYEIDTPIGTMLAGATSTGICMLEYTDSEDFVQRYQKVEKMLGREAVKGQNIHIMRLVQILEQYFQKQLTTFDLPLVFLGTEFQRQVWEALSKIPYGSTLSYSNFAARIGQQEALRAVAAAIGQNHISIIIPCHRVVGSDNKLTGYRGGLWRKHWLLRHETGRSVSTGEIPFPYEDLYSKTQH